MPRCRIGQHRDETRRNCPHEDPQVLIRYSMRAEISLKFHLSGEDSLSLSLSVSLRETVKGRSVTNALARCVIVTNLPTAFQSGSPPPPSIVPSRDLT
jgi:hypothetical protein